MEEYQTSPLCEEVVQDASSHLPVTNLVVSGLRTPIFSVYFLPFFLFSIFHLEFSLLDLVQIPGFPYNPALDKNLPGRTPYGGRPYGTIKASFPLGKGIQIPLGLPAEASQNRSIPSDL